MEINQPTTDEVQAVLDMVYLWCKNQQFTGYNKHDGLNSPLLKFTLGWAKWPRILAIQMVMRSPINLRPLLLIKKTYNPKGLALFVQALLNRYQYDGDQAHLADAEFLLDLLNNIKSSGSWSGNCWGYHYPWQDLGFFAPPETPNAVVTSFVCEAFLKAYRITGKKQYLETVAGAIAFFLKDLTILKDEPKELCLAYMPLPMNMRVMDVSILIGTVIAQYCELSNDDTHSDTARRLVNYVVNRQTEYGAWYYTDPPSDSLITHDNYHTGFILDALDRYIQATKTKDYENQYLKGLKYYANNLFNSDGSPRWMNDKDYPHDIHGGAQGILTFSRHSDEYRDLLNKIISWTLSKMYNSQGRFYYQETKYYIKSFTLLRWCNAWMIFALSSWLVNQKSS